MIAALVLSALISAPIVHHPVATTNPAAQSAFERGLLLLYAYNGEAAYDAFAQALRDDPHLAMAAWGEALASGGDLNTGLSSDRFDRAHEAALRAVSLEAFASSHDREYIGAVAARYGGTYADRDADRERYLAAMAAIVAQNPADNDALVLQAEGLMEQRLTDPTALTAIQTVLARDRNNVMANHLCIHAYDLREDRSPALACADRIAAWKLEPAEVHLAHMPAHAYIDNGLYARALQVCEYAWRLRQEPDAPPKYAQHDAYTGWSAAMMLGDSALAQMWAARTGAAYGGSDRFATWARFGQWALIEAADPAHEFYAALARGWADVHLGMMDDARRMLAVYANRDADYRWLLEAALDERDGHVDAAQAALRKAIAYQYQEDEGEQLPLFPAGEYLGALLYRHGRYSEALDAFEQTLAHYPNDPRALYGLALAQRALGQGVTAARTLKTFKSLWNAPEPPNME